VFSVFAQFKPRSHIQIFVLAI